MVFLKRFKLNFARTMNFQFQEWLYKFTLCIIVKWKFAWEKLWRIYETAENLSDMVTSKWISVYCSFLLGLACPPVLSVPLWLSLVSLLFFLFFFFFHLISVASLWISLRAANSGWLLLLLFFSLLVFCFFLLGNVSIITMNYYFRYSFDY